MTFMQVISAVIALALLLYLIAALRNPENYS